jgi:pimeloyl-ACP methyl ester carboxylesterase
VLRRDLERLIAVGAFEDVEAARCAQLVLGDVSPDPISSVAAPTLVIHGTADPMLPLAHGQALAEEIPGAKLLTLEGAGHGVERADWEPISRAILAHTADAEPVVESRRSPLTDSTRRPSFPSQPTRVS